MDVIGRVYDGFEGNHPHSYYVDEVVLRFLEEMDDVSDKHRHILRCFHENITDDQIKLLMRFFNNIFCAASGCIFKAENRYEIIRTLYFNRRCPPYRMLFSVDKNNWYQQDRIIGIRILHDKKWRVKKTLFTSNRAIRWKAKDPIYDNILYGYEHYLANPDKDDLIE